MKQLPNLLSAVIPVLLLTLECHAAHAEDWPHWRGADRSAITTEHSGWKNQSTPWPPATPLWQINVGEGAAAPIVIGDQIHFFGWSNDKDRVRCIDATTGKTLWQQSYPAPQYGRHSVGDKKMYRGTTATPEFDPASQLLFTLGPDGDLHAWDTTDKGAKKWHLNLYDQFKVPQRPQITKRRNTLRDYGYTTAPLVHGDTLIVEVGDIQGGCLKGFDKQTGKLLWQSENRDPAGHSGGLAPMTIAGIPCVALATSWNVLVVRLDGNRAGKTFAQYEWKTDFSNTIAGVAVSGSDILISSRYNQMAMERITVNSDGTVNQIWRNRYPTGVCTPIIDGDQIYFANRGIHCIDFATGDMLWLDGKIGDAGSCLLTSDKRLIVWGNGGDLSLIEGYRPAQKKFRLLAEKKKLFDDMAWPHLVLSNGYLLTKVLDGDVICFSVE